MKRIVRLLPFFIVFAGLGCKRNPDGILPIDKLKVVFFHHMMAEEMINNYIARDTAIDYDSARTAIFSGVMQHDKTDSATFIRSVNYYRADPERFSELLDSVNALATREKEFRDKRIEKAMRKKAVADSIAMVDSLAKLKNVPANTKDSVRRKADSLKSKKNPVATPGKDTVSRVKK